MHIFRKSVGFAAAFVFATGFAGSVGAQGGCDSCMSVYTLCMAEPDAEQWRCARDYNRCAEPMGCPLMPEF